jgi:hypothetical protein
VPIPHTPAERQQLLPQAVTVATWLVDGLAPHGKALNRTLRDVVATHSGAIRKVIADETTTDAAGMLQERALAEKGADRLLSDNQTCR